MKTSDIQFQYTIAADCFITPKGNLMDGIEMYSVNFRERKADCNPALSVTLRGHEVATYIDDYRWLRELNLPDGVTFSDINVCFPARR